jgi:hypothetical protein
MEQTLHQTVALLTHTPATLNALLRDLPNAWTSVDEGPETWTVFDVIAHMNHCERTDWMRRAKTILSSGEAQSFPPLNRAAHTEASQGKSLNQLLEEFSQLRPENLQALRALDLQPADLERRGLHPPSARSPSLSYWPPGPPTI